MKSLVRLSAVASFVVVIGLGSGCEWSSGSDVDSFNSRYDFINFSGLYRGLQAGLLITDYSSEVLVGDGVAVTDERIYLASSDGVRSIAPRVDYSPIVPGTLTIRTRTGSMTAKDDGEGGITFPDDWPDAEGTVNYGNGVISLTFMGGKFLNKDDELLATYKYTTGSGPLGNAVPGSSKPIYSFMVEQYGNKISITDNNGAIYQGTMGDIRSTGGVDQNNTSQNGGNFVPSAGDEFVGQFSATGTSAAGYKIRMVGSFQVVVQAAATSTTSGGGGDAVGVTTVSSVQLNQRELVGTWIEDGGKQGNIRGTASPISVTPPAATP